MEKRKLIRKYIRTVIAASFWVHALYVFHFVPEWSWTVSAIFAARSIYNVALVTFILYYSWFSDRGWFSVVYDLAYIYVWPFVVVIRTIWIISKFSYSYVKQHTHAAPVVLVNISTQPQVVSPQPDIKGAVTQIRAIQQPTRTSGARLILQPLLRFTFIWAIALIGLSWPPAIMAVSIIVLFGALRAVYSLWDLLTDTADWTGKLKSSFANQVADKIRQVREWEATSGTEAIAKEVNVLKLFESIFSYISRNRLFLARCTTAIAIIVTIPFYIYISFLFTAIYLGVAHVQHINLSFTDALLESLYIPFAFTDLPHSFVIRFIAGLQGILITLMGWNIFFRNLSGGFERMATGAEEIRSVFDEETYREKLALVILRVERKAEVPKKPSGRVKIPKARNQNKRSA